MDAANIQNPLNNLEKLDKQIERFLQHRCQNIQYEFEKLQTLQEIFKKVGDENWEKKFVVSKKILDYYGACGGLALTQVNTIAQRCLEALENINYKFPQGGAKLNKDVAKTLEEVSVRSDRAISAIECFLNQQNHTVQISWQNYLLMRLATEAIHSLAQEESFKKAIITAGFSGLLVYKGKISEGQEFLEIGRTAGIKEKLEGGFGFGKNPFLDHRTFYHNNYNCSGICFGESVSTFEPETEFGSGLIRICDKILIHMSHAVN